MSEWQREGRIPPDPALLVLKMSLECSRPVTGAIYTRRRLGRLRLIWGAGGGTAKGRLNVATRPEF
jgi:hypothetical protein